MSQISINDFMRKIIQFCKSSEVNDGNPLQRNLLTLTKLIVPCRKVSEGNGV